jgi:hypothetical protein
MARVGATVHAALGVLGVVQVCASAGLLVWSGRHYEELHGRLRAGAAPTHRLAVAVVGIGATAATALAIALAVLAVATGA